MLRLHTPTVSLLTAALAAQPVAFGLATERLVLDNGMTLILAPEPEAALVAVRLFYRVGSGDEQVGKTGMAHLFEHMMFNGSERFPAGRLDAVFERGGGYANAYTSVDFTCYTTEVPPESLPAVLEIEADRMLHLTLDAELLERERQVVLAERRQAIDDDPQAELATLAQAHLFLTHPYRWPVLGWTADIEAVTVASARAFYQRFYAPDRAVLVLAGSVQREQAEPLVRRLFADLPRGPGVAPRPRPEPDRTCGARLDIERDAPASVLRIGFLGPAADDPRHPAVDLLARVLGRGASARLARRLVRADRVAVDVDVVHDWTRDREPLWITATLASAEAAAAAEAAVFDELARLARDGCDGDELARARTGAVADLLRQMQTSGGRAFLLGKFEVVLDRHRRPFELPAAWDAVEPEALRAAAADLFRRERAVIAVLRARPAAAAEEEGR